MASKYTPIWEAVKANHNDSPNVRITIAFDPSIPLSLSTIKQGIKDAKAKDLTFDGGRYYLDFLELQPHQGYGFAIKLNRIYKPPKELFTDD